MSPETRISGRLAIRGRWDWRHFPLPAGLSSNTLSMDMDL